MNFFAYSLTNKKLRRSYTIFLAFLLIYLYSYFEKSINETNVEVNKNSLNGIEFEDLMQVTQSKGIKNSDKIKACIFILVRNQDLKTLKTTMIQFEKQFNSKFNYPYVLMNHENFTDEFRNEIINSTKSKIEFGAISHEHWSIPDWINKTELNHRFRKSLKSVFHGTEMSYHFMCRYFSGFFFRHQLTLKYDYYWRLDHHVSFPCKIDEDPFVTLKNENKKYGFVIARDEDMSTIPTLWKTINKWLETSIYENKMPLDNSRSFVSSDGINTNTCHFWNNFEVASFELFRNDVYLSYFDYLDKTGGFFYERWGDAPVHTYFVVLMTKKSELIKFENIGYGHDIVFTWPKNKSIECVENTRVDSKYIENCTREWYKSQNLTNKLS